MLKGFGSILLKELKELIRDPKIIVGMIILPLIMFPVLGLIFGYAQQTAVDQAQHAKVLILNNDGGNWSQNFISYMNNFLNVTVIENVSPNQALEQKLLEEYKVTTFIEIPSDFSSNMTMHLESNPNVTAMINSYSIFEGVSLFSGSESAIAITANIISRFNRAIAPNVVYSTPSTIIKGQIETGVDPQELSVIMLSQTIALPLTVMILLTYAMQIAATSVAMEKEEKTLETLLTAPVDRFAILMGKLSSTIIVAGVAALAIMVGYNYMLGSITMGIEQAVSVDLIQLGLVPSAFGYGLLGLSLFITLLSALALAVVISAFSEDVRGAQALVGYIYPLIFIPALALLYVDFNSLPAILKTVFYAIPYSHPIIASRAVVVGDYSVVIFGIIYVAVFSLIVMYLASRLFATEKILTTKLGWKFRSKKNEEKM